MFKRNILLSNLIILLLMFTLAACGGGGGGGGGGASPVAVSQDVGVSGGTVEVTDVDNNLYGAAIIIQAGALAGDTTITISKNTDPTILNGIADENIIVVYGPDGTTLISPSTITIPYDDTDITTEDNMVVCVYNVNTSEWDDATTIGVDTADNTLLATVSALGAFMAQEGAVYYADTDGDGYGDPAVSAIATSQPSGYVTDATDCDDSDPTLNPGITEVCDGIDNNCDLQIDEGVKTTYYADVDTDGYGDAAFSQDACTQPVGYVEDATDCDDTDPLEHPNQAWYKDYDSDDYSNGTLNYWSCTRPGGFYVEAELTAITGDCDDSDPLEFPDQTWYEDVDGDGYSTGTTDVACLRPAGYRAASELTALSGECDDTDALEHPDQTWYKDVDDDGYSDGVTDTTSCTRPTDYKVASELTDITGDVDDTDDTVYPGAPEICGDGVDNDSNGSIDDLCSIVVPGDYGTIQGAIDVASIGAVVTVDAGTYYENIDYNGTVVTVQSASGADSTTIDGGASGTVVTFNSGETATSVLDGFTITNGLATNGGGLLLSNTSPVIKNCKINNNYASSDGGGVATYGGTPTFINCMININSTANTENHEGGGMYISGSLITLTNCTITDNSAYTGEGIFSSNATATITNCVIANNSPTYGDGLYIANSSSVTVVNSIIWDNTITLYSSGLNISYSDVDPSQIYGSGAEVLTNNVNGDPLFIDSNYVLKIYRDYRITAGSVCIDAGTATGAPADDINGDARPVNGVMDIGIDETSGVDADADGVFSDSDCDDTTATTHPGAQELCADGVDNNCDGQIDERCLRVPETYGTIQAAVDVASDGYTVFVNDGTYSENVLVDGIDIIVQSVNGAATTTIDGGAAGAGITFNSISTHTSIFDGFTVTNGASAAGAGIYSYLSSLEVKNSIIDSNVASGGFGAGIYIRGTYAAVDNCIITNNSGSSNGGGVNCWSTYPSISNSTISDNTTNAYGGGIYGVDTITNCIISNNAGTLGYSAGGGIYGGATITNCTISDNYAASGGGIYGGATITNTTVANNESLYGGGGLKCDFCEVISTNTIFWGNTDNSAGDDMYVNGSSATATFENSDIDPANIFTYLGTVTWLTGNIVGDPLFVDDTNADVSLRDYHLSLITSPCVDAGVATGTNANAPTDDIDGDARPIGSGIDIGADEAF